MDARALPPRPSIAQYRKQAKELLRSAHEGDADAVKRLRDVPHARRLAADDDTPAHVVYALADAQFVIAREHGFASWPVFAAHVEALAIRDTPAARFEAAADAVVEGDETALSQLLTDDPSLTRARSTRAHHATLLHYVSANGVEDFRQRSPRNAAAIATALLAAGAQADAPANTYGGGPWQTTLNLLVSSVHPARARVQEALVDTLIDHGAAVDGVADDGSPLLTALAFHYAGAAHALARRGARVDTLAAAAGLGDESRVQSFLASGVVQRGAHRAMPRWLPLSRDADAHRALALTWAAAFGHRRVVELLADAGIASTRRTPKG